MPHDHVNTTCKSKAPALRGAEAQVVDVPAAPQAHAFRAPNIAQSERFVLRSRAHVLPFDYIDPGGWSTPGRSAAFAVLWMNAAVLSATPFHAVHFVRGFFPIVGYGCPVP